MTRVASRHLRSVAEAILATDLGPVDALARVLDTARRTGRRVYVFGNGACAALASHMATDLGKITSLDLGQGPGQLPAPGRIRIMALTDNAALITALGNDVRFEDVFLEQLKSLAEPHDVVIGLSGSGSSPNVVRALEYARNLGATTVGFTSSRASSEAMRRTCDLCLIAPLEGMEAIEDVHVALHHAVTLAVVELQAEPLREVQP